MPKRFSTETIKLLVIWSEHFCEDTSIKTNIRNDRLFAISISIFRNINYMAPFKMEVLRFNNNSLMNKSLGKAIMVRSRLKYKFNRNCSGENWNSY